MKKKYRILDVHGHIGYYKLFNMPGCNADDMVNSMDRAGIEKIMISSMIALEADCVYGNDMTADAIRRYPDRFLGYAAINPYEQEEIIPELSRCFDELSMTAIKLHPDLNDCPADSDLFIPVYRFANERNLIIMNHSWGSSSNLTKLSTKYPNIKFIQAHYGSSWDGSRPLEIFETIKKLDNVYLDTAGSGSYYGAFEKTFEYFGEDKLIFGTDFPFFDAAWQIGNVVCSDIPEKSKQKILCDNFLRLLS